VGIMFGLATYKFNTIWASITLHFFWNLSQLLLITEKESQYSIWQYVVHTNNIAITGNQFGYEASIISIAGYIGVIFILLMIKHRGIQ
ncbi:CPBP family intramembrane glutamate endopeptidase, partial [Staphylococcus epidermidis]